MSIRRRILITFTMIVVVGGVVQLLIAGSQLQSATLDFYQTHLESSAAIASVTFASAFDDEREGGRRGQEDVPNTLAAVEEQVGQEFLLLDANARVIADSSGSSYQVGESFPVAPETIDARYGGSGYTVLTDLSGVERMYVAEGIRRDERLIGYVVLSQPIAPIYVEIGRRWLGLILATLPVIGLVIAASLWISTSISQPIQKLRNSALRMAEGAFDTRIKVTSKDEVGQLAHAFNYMAEQIEKLLRTQRSFVSNAAHELRNPLMTLKLRVEALQEGTLTDAQHELYLVELAQEIGRMSALTNALLVLARVDEGRHETDSPPYDSAALLHDLARHWRIEARAAKLDFEAQVASDLPDLPIPANDLRLILDNLLNNAIKYTPRGKVTLCASAENGAVRLRVVDTGYGFAPEEAERLFDRFYRTPEARELQIAGTGLGLAIVKAVVEYHHGTITAASEGAARGAAFTVMLPLPQSKG